MADTNKKLFTVLWTAQRQDRHSAQMTVTEAQKFADKLRTDKAEGVTIREEADEAGSRTRRAAA